MLGQILLKFFAAYILRERKGRAVKEISRNKAPTHKGAVLPTGCET